MLPATGSHCSWRRGWLQTILWVQCQCEGMTREFTHATWGMVSDVWAVWRIGSMVMMHILPVHVVTCSLLFCPSTLSSSRPGTCLVSCAHAGNFPPAALSAPSPSSVPRTPDAAHSLHRLPGAWTATHSPLSRGGTGQEDVGDREGAVNRSVACVNEQVGATCSFLLHVACVR